MPINTSTEPKSFCMLGTLQQIPGQFSFVGGAPRPASNNITKDDLEFLVLCVYLPSASGTTPALSGGRNPPTEPTVRCARQARQALYQMNHIPALADFLMAERSFQSGFLVYCCASSFCLFLLEVKGSQSSTSKCVCVSVKDIIALCIINF